MKQRHIRVLFLLLSFATSIISEAVADSAPKPFSESRAYFGVEAGWKRARTRGDEKISRSGFVDTQTFNIKKNKSTGDFFIGYKEIKKHFMHGLEITPYNFYTSKLTTDLTHPGGPGAVPFGVKNTNVTLKGHIIGPITIVLGIPIKNRIMPYGKFGLSAGHFKARYLESGIDTGKSKKWRFGFNAGGGLEIALTNKISSRVEYRYDRFMRFRTKKLSSSSSLTQVNQKHTPSTSTILFGLLYHVDPQK